MRSFQCLLLATAACIVAGQSSHTTPVPILKQVNKQNDDGSYSFGYEAADGSYKIETKYPSGEVAGKYGYVDDSGNLREVEYGASSKRGFEPQGSGINVPPPTLNEPSNELQSGDEDDGQYREDPSIYEKDPKYSYPRTQSQSSRRPVTTVFQQSYQPQEYQQYKQPAVQQYKQPAIQKYRQPAVQQYQQPAIQQYQQPAVQQYQQPAVQQYQETAPQQYQQPAFSQARQFPSPVGGSRIYHQQPEFSYQQFQPYQAESYQQPQYNQFPSQQFIQYPGHPAQNLDLGTGSYSINYSG